MPIEIMELVVRARVRDEERSEENQHQDTSGTSRQVAATENELQRAAEVVQEILKRQKER